MNIQHGKLRNNINELTPDYHYRVVRVAPTTIKMEQNTIDLLISSHLSGAKDRGVNKTPQMHMDGGISC